MPLTVNLHAFEVPASESKPSRLRTVVFRLLSLAFSGALLFIALEVTLRVTVETTFTAQTDAGNAGVAPSCMVPHPSIGNLEQFGHIIKAEQ